MFGRWATDRHALLLLAGVALAAAYVAGGAAVSGGFEHALELRHEAHAAAPVLLDAWAPGAREVRLGEARDADGAWRVVAFLRGDPSPIGLGSRVGAAHLTFAEAEITISVRHRAEDVPQSWVFVDEATFAAISPERVETLWLAPADAAAGVEDAVPLSGGPSFMLRSAHEFSRGFLILVGATAFVAGVIAASLADGAVTAHARELHLFRSLGATRAHVVGAMAGWLGQLLATGLAVGAAAGIVAAYAVFSIGNRVGIRAPVVPAPAPFTLLMSLALIGAVALVAGLAAGLRTAARLEARRLEAPS